MLRHSVDRTVPAEASSYALHGLEAHGLRS